MKIGYFDCFSGNSGNMVLGALVDAGVDVERLRREHRYKLSREVVVVDTANGPIAVKVARQGCRVMNVALEHRDCQRAAEEQGMSIKVGHQATLAAALSRIEHG